ncbi:hypothetical protein ABLE68_13265 [Nocardioides sp. CN2-186]|uniref:hypothetical protein n=1 Tax=Nocardioides tweenelious TaxID=3156607 RepID=UPI0032B3C9AF
MQRWIVVLGLALVVGGLGAAPADASISYSWRFDSRPAGLPAATVPAQTLVFAAAGAESGEGPAQLRAEVVLGGVPDASTKSYLEIALGVVQDDGTCAMDWQLTVPTDEPGGPVTRGGDRLSISTTLAPLDFVDRCGWVQLTAADGTVLDRLDAPGAGTAIGDPGGVIRIRAVDGLRVQPHQWARIWVRIGYHGSPAHAVRLSGKGRGVDVRTTLQDVELRDGDSLWIPLRVRLTRSAPAQVALDALPRGYLAFPQAGHRDVVLRPAR